MLKFIIHKSLIPFVKYLKRQTDTQRERRVLDEVSRRIVQKTADYIEEQMTTSIVFNRRELLWDYVFSKSSNGGSIIIFDEYFGYLGWKVGEYKAFQELIQKKQLKYKYLGFSETSVAIEMI